MEQIEQSNYVDSLEDFSKLPPKAQKAFFAGENPPWPKNKDGIRVKPRRKKRSTTNKKQGRPKATRKKSTHKKHRYSSSGMSNSQKWAIGLSGLAVITWVLVKRPS
jgi:hypothetical protein